MADPVSYEELHFSMHAGVDGAEGTHILRIDGDQAEALLTERLGCTFVEGQGYTVEKVTWHPDYNWLYVSDIRFDPDEPEDQPHDSGRYYNKLRATISYKGTAFVAGQPDDPSVPQDTYLTHTAEATQQFMTLPGYALVWEGSDDPVAEDLDVGMQIATIVHRMTWHGVLYPPWDWIRGLVGCVNGENWGWFKKETLLYAGWGSKRTWNAAGSASFILDYTLVEKVIPDPGNALVGAASDMQYYGWNHYYKAGNNPEWVRVKNPTTNQYPYPRTDALGFAPLFSW
jgi:hypothetical protein